MRVVSIHSREASDAIVGGTAADRLALVETLSAMQWRLSGRPLPIYTRATMPGALVPLRSTRVGE
ncbi:MAG: hypothetical protein IT359_04225 [Gemmatimonadaceae bacterium]|nr:hypothetical protein [Gemmatimonadaceae bacterium]